MRSFIAKSSFNSHPLGHGCTEHTSEASQGHQLGWEAMLRGRASMLLSLRSRVAVGAAAAVAGGATLLATARAEPSLPKDLQGEPDVEVMNWSMTHSVTAKRMFQPESPEEVQRLLEACDAAGQRVRVVGSAISPNGIGLSDQVRARVSPNPSPNPSPSPNLPNLNPNPDPDPNLSEQAMLNMAQCDRILSVDAERQQATSPSPSPQPSPQPSPSPQPEPEPQPPLHPEPQAGDRAGGREDPGRGRGAPAARPHAAG